MQTAKLKAELVKHKQRQRESSQMVAAINRELKNRKKTNNTNELTRSTASR